MILELIFKWRLLFIFALPCTLSAQGLPRDEDVKFGVIQHEHLYLKNIRSTTLDALDDGVVDNIPTSWVRVNKDGLFHTLDKPEAISNDSDLQPWDSLYYATRDYLTFYFDESVYKEETTSTSVFDGHEPPYNLVGRIKGTFINGVKEGQWEKEACGRIKGKYVSGKVIEENYKNSALNGVRTVYSQEGACLYETIFVNGTGTYRDYYYNVGKIAVSGFLVYGKRHGCWNYYNKDERVIREEHYKDGLLHGPFTIYDSLGNLIYKTHFVNGTGEYRIYKNDVLKEKGQMVNGLRSGEWIENRIGFDPRTPDIGPIKYERRVTYTERSPINDTHNMIDVMFSNGDYIYIRATKDE